MFLRDKEKKKQYDKEYHLKNKEKRLQYNKEWRLKK
jgi:acid phosphatase class B